MNLIEEMEKYASENYVPIIRKANLEYLINLIKQNHYLRILEIGTAIGYCCINLALINKNIKVTTIEKDEAISLIAQSNIKNAKLENQITLINDDALNVTLNESFDLIFIDGAKSSYSKFFEKFSFNLKENGIIVSDNIDLIDLQKMTNSKKSLKLVEKMKRYKEYLTNLEQFETIFVCVGDGFAITKRK